MNSPSQPPALKFTRVDLTLQECFETILYPIARGLYQGQCLYCDCPDSLRFEYPSGNYRCSHCHRTARAISVQPKPLTLEGAVLDDLPEPDWESAGSSRLTAVR